MTYPGTFPDSRPHSVFSDVMMLVINPISGTGSKKGVAEAVEKRLKAHGIRLDVRSTGARGDATAFAGEASGRGYRGVLVCGGDGTVNEAALALRDSGTPMGILPAGSGNGLARHLGIPVDIDAAMEIILRNNVVMADYGTVNSIPFFCTFGMGFDAAVSHRFARQGRRGMLSYIRSALSE
ncbi:MAG: acylglycerol kinase family protein [Muribaculaceae bacterium]|nr:acylglycerol kinase family protein [Muribaculaceae bacterium]